MNYEPLTERARMVIIHAIYEASQIGFVTIGTEALLLALLKDDISAASTLLAKYNITYDKVLNEIKSIPNYITQNISPHVNKTFSPSAKRAIHTAWQTARYLKSNYIDTKHILTGLITENSVAAKTLTNLGINLEKLNEFLLTNDTIRIV